MLILPSAVMSHHCEEESDQPAVSYDNIISREPQDSIERAVSNS